MTKLEKLGRDTRAASKRLDALRSQLADTIVAEAQAGTRPIEIARQSGYTRERVRQILRAAGIEAS